MNGKLTGVGVGPGDPELLTLKAICLIQNAPILAYTVNAEGKSCARDIAADYIRVGQKELPLWFSMSTQRADRLQARQAAAETVLNVLHAGVDIIFLTEGDPLLYSTFQHLLAAMPPEIPVSVCPGISAMCAAASAACFPLALEGQKLMVSPAEEAIGHIGKWLAQGKSIVLYKVAPWVQVVAAEANAACLPCDRVLVERASMQGESVLRQSEDWSLGDAPYFSIILLRPLSSARGEE